MSSIVHDVTVNALCMAGSPTLAGLLSLIKQNRVMAIHDPIHISYMGFLPSENGVSLRKNVLQHSFQLSAIPKYIRSYLFLLELRLSR